MTQPDPNPADPSPADPIRLTPIRLTPIRLTPIRLTLEPGRDRTDRRGTAPRPALGARRAPRAGRRDHPRAPAAGDVGDRRPRRRPQAAHGARAPGRLRRHRAGREGARLPDRRRLRRRLRWPGRGGARRPVPVPAHAGRVRPVPDRRGTARGAVAGARRARPRGRARRTRHGVRRLGAERPRCPRHRRLQLLGRPRVPDALARRVRGVGAVRAGRRRGRQVQVRDLRPGRGVAGEGRPDGQRGRDAARHRVGGVHLAVRLGRRRLDDGAGRAPSRCASR